LTPSSLSTMVLWKSPHPDLESQSTPIETTNTVSIEKKC
jgi:hypothetical protein